MAAQKKPRRRRSKLGAEIVVLPGVERRDLAGVPLPSAEILQAAIDEGVTDAIVVGRDRQGNLYVAGAPPDVDKTVGLLMRAVTTLSEATIINDVKLGGGGT